MNDISENRASRYSIQDQYNRYINSKSENFIYNRQYFNQNNFNYRNQNNSYQSASNVASNSAHQQYFRILYQYDKEKTSYQSKSIHVSHDFRIQISKPVQSFNDQRQKVYYADENDYRYQKYSTNFSDDCENQKNAYNDQKQKKYHNEKTIFVHDDSQQKDEFEEISHNFFVDTSIFCNLTHQCRKCDVKCFFDNKLYKHLKKCRTLLIMQRIVNSIEMQIIESKKKSMTDANYDIVLRKWHYFMIKTCIIKTVFNFFCLNTKCEMSMIDKEYLCKLISNYKLTVKTSSSIKVRDIEKTIITFNERIELNLEIFDLFNERATIARIKRMFHIVENFTTKILIEMNIIESERIKIDCEKVHIESCNVVANLKLRSSAESKIKRIVMCFTAVTVLSHINMFVSIIIRKKFKILSNKDFIFNSTHDQRLDQKENILFHIVNANFSQMNIRNITNTLVFMFCRFRLKLIQKYENKDCYLISSNDAHLTTKQWTIRVKKLKV